MARSGDYAIWAKYEHGVLTIGDQGRGYWHATYENDEWILFSYDMDEIREQGRYTNMQECVEDGRRMT